MATEAKVVTQHNFDARNIDGLFDLECLAYILQEYSSVILSKHYMYKTFVKQ